jgi:hypothetical protein
VCGGIACPAPARSGTACLAPASRTVVSVGLDPSSRAPSRTFHESPQAPHPPHQDHRHEPDPFRGERKQRNIERTMSQGLFCRTAHFYSAICQRSMGWRARSKFKCAYRPISPVSALLSIADEKLPLLIGGYGPEAVLKYSGRNIWKGKIKKPRIRKSYVVGTNTKFPT